MKTNNKQKIITEIFYKKRQLEQLKPNIATNKMSNNLYNKILIEKAILQKNLNTLTQSGVSKFVKSIFKPKAKLISDYFKDNCPMI